MSTRMRWVSGATDYSFSLLCRYRNPKNYYLLGVLVEAANIARYRKGRLTSLTRGIQRSTYVADEANDVTVRCIGDRPTTLTRVNGPSSGRCGTLRGWRAATLAFASGRANRS